MVRKYHRRQRGYLRTNFVLAGEVLIGNRLTVTEWCVLHTLCVDEHPAIAAKIDHAIASTEQTIATLLEHRHATANH